MKVLFHKSFSKAYKKLPPKLKSKTDIAIAKFRANPFDATLNNHQLTGKLKGQRAFSVTGNFRVIFEEYDDYVVVLMLDVGTHPQVYGV
jgi:addiction module RelE/StbE family toxin